MESGSARTGGLGVPTSSSVFQFIKSLQLRAYFLPTRFHPGHDANISRSARNNDGKAPCSPNVSTGATKCRLPGIERRRRKEKEGAIRTWMAYCAMTGIRRASRVSRSPSLRPRGLIIALAITWEMRKSARKALEWPYISNPPSLYLRQRDDWIVPGDYRFSGERQVLFGASSLSFVSSHECNTDVTVRSRGGTGANLRSAWLGIETRRRRRLTIRDPQTFGGAKSCENATLSASTRAPGFARKTENDRRDISTGYYDPTTPTSVGMESINPSRRRTFSWECSGETLLISSSTTDRERGRGTRRGSGGGNKTAYCYWDLSAGAPAWPFGRIEKVRDVALATFCYPFCVFETSVSPAKRVSRLSFYLDSVPCRKFFY